MRAARVSIFGWALAAQHYPGWRAPVGRAVVAAYTAGVIGAARLRGVEVKDCGGGMIAARGPQTGRFGGAQWADTWGGLTARHARLIAETADRAAAYEAAERARREALRAWMETRC